MLTTLFAQIRLALVSPSYGTLKVRELFCIQPIGVNRGISSFILASELRVSQTVYVDRDYPHFELLPYLQ